MNPKQLGLMVHPVTGRVAIVLKKPTTTQVLKDVTVDFVLMQAAEIMKHDNAEGIETVFTATDSHGNAMEIEITARILSQERSSP